MHIVIKRSDEKKDDPKLGNVLLELVTSWITCVILSPVTRKPSLSKTVKVIVLKSVVKRIGLESEVTENPDSAR